MGRGQVLIQIQVQVDVQVRDLVEQLLTDQLELFLAALVLLLGFVLAVATWLLLRRFLGFAGVPDAVEGTPFERTARRLGTSTVSLLSQLSGLFVLGLATLAALNILGFIGTGRFVARFTAYLPRAFVAVVVVIVGLITGEKAEMRVSEKLQGIKLEAVDFLPTTVKYSVFFVAALIALSQLGVATGALLVVLTAYLFGVVVVSTVAFWDLLASGAAGVYLLLTEPYAIGDEVEIDGKRGIVQEISVFVTHVENDDREFVIPNRVVFRNGIVRIR